MKMLVQVQGLQIWLEGWTKEMMNKISHCFPKEHRKSGCRYLLVRPTCTLEIHTSFSHGRNSILHIQTTHTHLFIASKAVLGRNMGRLDAVGEGKDIKYNRNRSPVFFITPALQPQSGTSQFHLLCSLHFLYPVLPLYDFWPDALKTGSFCWRCLSLISNSWYPESALCPCGISASFWM